jgi:hypothetical protein
MVVGGRAARTDSTTTVQGAPLHGEPLRQPSEPNRREEEKEAKLALCTIRALVRALYDRHASDRMKKACCADASAFSTRPSPLGSCLIETDDLEEISTPSSGSSTRRPGHGCSAALGLPRSPNVSPAPTSALPRTLEGRRQAASRSRPSRSTFSWALDRCVPQSPKPKRPARKPIWRASC